MDDIFKFSIMDILKEADDDGTDIINGGPANTENDDTNTGDEGNNDAATDTNNNDDDFNIDTSLDSDEGGEDNEEGGDDLGGGDDNLEGGNDSGSSDEEVNPANTDVFATLTAEEQKIKIMQLKKQYNDLYTYCDDLLTKMNDMNLEEDTLEVVSKTSSHLYSLKDYIRDYMIDIFPLKSYIENDIFYNRFLATISSIEVIISQLATGREKKLGIEEENN